MLMRGLFFIFLTCVGSSVFAETVLPVSLNQSHREKLLAVLGFGTAPKIISNPYPLGGYEGWELGFTSEFLSLEEVAGLGSAPAGKSLSRGEFNFYNLSISKGIFENIDTTVSFMPSLQGEVISGYGLNVRWTFYESPYIPLALTTSIYTGGVNIQSLLGTSTQGVDLLCTMSMEDLAMYFGFGEARANGLFTGGSGGLTLEQKQSSETVSSSHSLFGLSFMISKVLLGFQVDRFVDPVYGARLAWRY